MELNIAVITYIKDGKLNILNYNLLESISRSSKLVSLKDTVRLIVFINEDIGPDFSPYVSQIHDRLGKTNILVEVVSYGKMRVPTLRNIVLTHIQFGGYDGYLFMPDDDDELGNVYTLPAILSMINSGISPYRAILGMFYDQNGNIVPNNKRRKSDYLFQQTQGWMNWNIIYPIRYFHRHMIGFPEYLEHAPFRSHDTVASVEFLLYQLFQDPVVLAQPLIKYRKVEGSLSSRKRLDTPLNRFLEYLYTDAKILDPKEFYWFDPMISTVLPITQDQYHDLSFSESEDIEVPEDQAVVHLGRYTDTITVSKITKVNGMRYALCSFGKMNRLVRVYRYGYIADTHKNMKCPSYFILPEHKRNSYIIKLC